MTASPHRRGCIPGTCRPQSACGFVTNSSFGRAPRLPAAPIALLGVLFLTLAACASPAVDSEPRIVRPGAPGQGSQVVTTADVGAPHPHTAADVRFMQDMVIHHIQALEMSSLIRDRAGSPDILLLGRRISVSQQDEIAIARRWLEDRGEAVPEVAGTPPGTQQDGTHDHTAIDHYMPGMLSAAQMEHLAASSGRDFDILFLAAMIQHHEGALTMVAELFDSPGAAHEDEVFQFASHVEADQRIEIARMQRMLNALLPRRQ